MTVPRDAGDVPTLVTALRAVHERDGYPVRWKADPAAWLTPDGLQAAWVVEQAGHPVGHAALAAVEPGEPAAAAWARAAGQAPEELSCLSSLVGLSPVEMKEAGRMARELFPTY